MSEEKKWLKHYPADIPASMEYDARPLPSYLKEGAELHPHKSVLHFMGKDMSYSELYEEASRLAGQLGKMGIEKGDRVAIMLPNSPQSVIGYYGVLMAGAIVVQSNPLYVERELKHQLNDSEARCIICLDLLYPRVKKVRDQSNLQHVIVTSIRDYLPFPKNVLYPIKKQNRPSIEVEYNSTTHSFKKLVKERSVMSKAVEVDPINDLALLQYTGGTTGPAKGVQLTHFNLVANTLQCRAWMYRMKKGEEKLLAVLPFFHVYGMTVVMNLSVIFTSQMIILPKFEPVQVLRTIQKHKVTLFPGAPAMYIGLINEPEIDMYDLSSVEACISGSAPLPVQVQEAFEKKTGGKLVEGYGLTEASPVVTANPIWGERKSGSIGIPWPDTDICIFLEDGKISTYPGEVGELAVRGPQIMKGYWKRPEETKAAFRNGWLLTGDMGYMDEDGYFYIADRKKDIIIAGGYNVFPREVEEVLLEHPAIEEAAVIGVPDRYRGETVKAFIVCSKGKRVSTQELETFCRTYLASYKVPRLFEFREDLPKSMIGKVLRRLLKEGEKDSSNDEN